MKFKYLDDTDTFYIIFSDKKSIESNEISENVIADYDIEGNMIGMEILSAKSLVDFNMLSFDSLPFQSVNIVNGERILKN